MNNSMESGYNAAVSAIKQAILQSQYQAAKGVNRVQLSLYFSVGKYVSENSRCGFWGTGAIESISGQLQKELPGLRGFSPRNIKNMRLFYEKWQEVFLVDYAIDNSADTSAEIEQGIFPSALLAIPPQKLWQTLSAEFEMEWFLSIGFSHHLAILTETKSLEERIFYIEQAAINLWSYRHLCNQLKADAFHHQGNMPNNFEQTIPDSRHALKAISTFKDQYLLDFINVEELEVRDDEDIDERVLEQSIVHHIKNFILTFGRGFSFVGNQYRLEVGDESFFVDLLFFNREIQSLVAIELKAGKFKPSYLGQLNFYLQALDDKVRLPHENPTIGLVLCKEANRTIAEYAVRDYAKPMGVATYRTSAEMPEKLRNALPDIEDLKKLL